MTERMIKICICVAILTIMALGRKQADGQEPSSRWRPEQGRLEVIQRPDYGNWLTVVWSGGKREPIWHPNWTSIVVDFKPMVKKLPYGKYEITFTSDLTEGLP